MMDQKPVPTSICLFGEYLRKNPSWHVEGGLEARQVMQLMQRNGLDPKSIGEVGTEPANI